MNNIYSVINEINKNRIVGLNKLSDKDDDKLCEIIARDMNIFADTLDAEQSEKFKTVMVDIIEYIHMVVS